jgi:hypothetical protein
MDIMLSNLRKSNKNYMKKILLLLLFFPIVTDLQANVLTVSNMPGVSAQYKDVLTALTAADAADIIYIQGSETLCESFTINKRLTIISPDLYLYNIISYPLISFHFYLILL